MSVDLALLDRLEQLAAIDSRGEPADVRAQLCADLSRILQQAESLDRVLELGQAAPLEALQPAVRADLVRPGVSREQALAAAPANDGEHFVVPRVVP